MFSVSLIDLQNCKFYIFLTDYEKSILVSFILEGPLCRYSFIYMTVYWSEDEFTKEPAESCCCFDCSWPDNNKAWKWSCVWCYTDCTVRCYTQITAKSDFTVSQLYVLIVPMMPHMNHINGTMDVQLSQHSPCIILNQICYQLLFCFQHSIHDVLRMTDWGNFTAPFHFHCFCLSSHS